MKYILLLISLIIFSTFEFSNSLNARKESLLKRYSLRIAPKTEQQDPQNYIKDYSQKPITAPGLYDCTSPQPKPEPKPQECVPVKVTPVPPVPKPEECIPPPVTITPLPPLPKPKISIECEIKEIPKPQ